LQAQEKEIMAETCEKEIMVSPPEDPSGLNLMRQFSKASSGNDRGLHVQIMKKLDQMNLKSPKA